MNSYITAKTKEEYSKQLWDMIVDDLSTYFVEHTFYKTKTDTHPCNKLTIRASNIIDKNKETFVAQWILKNTDKDISDYTLFYHTDWTGQEPNKFWIGKKTNE